MSDRQRSFVRNDQQTVFFPLDCSVPQGSVLRPLEFVAYTEDSSDVVAKHDINQHAYADDNQLHTSCFPSDVARARQRLSECTADLVVWCAQRRLQLNANKTEVRLVGSRHNLTKLGDEDLSLTDLNTNRTPEGPEYSRSTRLSADQKLVYFITNIFSTLLGKTGSTEIASLILTYILYATLQFTE